MKKILLSLFVITMCFTLVGCGNSNTNNEKANNSTNNSSTTQNDNSNDMDNSKFEVDINNLHSDSKQIVLKNTETSFIVLPYKNDKITQHFTCLKKDSNSEAQKMYDDFRKNLENDGLDAYVKDNYFIYEHKKDSDEYVGQSASGIKMAFSNMVQ